MIPKFVVFSLGGGGGGVYYCTIIIAHVVHISCIEASISQWDIFEGFNKLLKEGIL